jgi:hypothetical protein
MMRRLGLFNKSHKGYAIDEIVDLKHPLGTTISFLVVVSMRALTIEPCVLKVKSL